MNSITDAGWKDGIVVRTTCIALTVVATACQDAPVVPVVAPPAKVATAMKGCTVVNALGRFAATTDTALCGRTGGALHDYWSTPSWWNPGLFGAQEWDDYHHNSAIEATAGQLGMTTARIPLNWNGAETGNGVYDWTYINALHDQIDALGAQGIGAYLQITGTPQWANGCDCAWWPPADGTFNEFLTHIIPEFATPSGGHFAVTAFAYGNEPNQMWEPQSWISYENRMSSFVAQVQALAAVAHQYSGVRVLEPELADGSPWGADSESWLTDFLNRAGSVTDIVTLHSYRPRSGWERIQGYGRGQGSIDEIKHFGDIAGMAGRWFWVTEFGTPTTDEKFQADFVVDVLQFLVAHPVPRLDKTFFFSQYQDVSEPGFFPWGLMTINPTVAGGVQKRQAYWCFRMLAVLNQFPGNGSSCGPAWQPYTGPPLLALNINGTNNLYNNDIGTWSLSLTDGNTPTNCNWYVDGQPAQYDGTCTFSTAWSDGPSSHVLTAIADDGGAELGSANFTVWITTPDCPTCLMTPPPGSGTIESPRSPKSATKKRPGVTTLKQE